MTEDMFKMTELITSGKQFSEDFNKYDRVYPYTTENIAGYMKDVEDKTVLSVVGSGDHYLNLVSLGASHVDSFDINKFAIYYLKLKKAAVLALTKREFFEFLTNNSTLHYKKVKRFLDAEALSFWNYYIDHFSKNGGIQSTYLFFPRTLGGEYVKINNYMSSVGYEKLKSNLENHVLEDCYQGDVYSICEMIDKKYDLIYLSSICNYQKDLDAYKKLISNIRDKNLNNGGKLYCGYFYSGINDNSEEFKDIYNSEIINIPGVTNNEASKDKVLILKK